MTYIVFFDGVCNLCNNSVDFILKRDPHGKFKFASLQSEAAAELLEQHGVDKDIMHTIVLLKNDKVYFRSNAILEIARDLRNPWPLLYIFKLVPGFIRDVVYKFISNNRYRWFGKRDTCRVPTDEERDRFLEQKTDVSSVNNKSQIPNPK